MVDFLRVAMEIPPDSAFACPAAGMARTLAERAGFGQRESYRFQLTVEEFCLCLMELLQADDGLGLAMDAKPSRLRAVFSFNAKDLSLGGLNLTAKAQACVEGEPGQGIGLLLAGKAADRFHLEQQGGEAFRLVAEVDRRYPELTPVATPEDARPPYRLDRQPDPARLCQAAALAMGAYPAGQCPNSFQWPEKFAALVAEGEKDGLVALDAAGRTVGLLVWTPCSAQALNFSGPYVFAPQPEREGIVRLLTDGFLEAVARDHHVIVLSFRATADLPAGYFEPLGSLLAGQEGDGHDVPVVFRHLREDIGAAVWCAPGLQDFLRQAYDRLAMPRDILPVEAPSGRVRRESLLGASLDRHRDLAELRLFLDGQDLAANLTAHVAAIGGKGIHRILYYMDLSRPWEAAVADDLLRAGFVPRLVLPHGGQSDMVVWQHEQPA